MNPDTLNQTINEVSLNAILAIVSLIMAILGIILSVLFFNWGRKEQKEASKIYNEVFLENSKLINLIHEKINILGQSEEKTRDTLIKAIIDKMNAQAIPEKIKEQVDKSNLDSGIGDSETFKSLINESFIEDVSRENLKQIQDASIILSELNRTELSVIFLIWNYLNRKIIITKELIESESNITKQEIDAALHVLKGKGLLKEDFMLNPTYTKVLNNLFDIEEYTGMRFYEKINSLSELIKRIPKVI
jgi:hypothetical protein